MPRMKTEGVREDPTTSTSTKPRKPPSKEKAVPLPDTEAPFTIVGIGASAGLEKCRIVVSARRSEGAAGSNPTTFLAIEVMVKDKDGL